VRLATQSTWSFIGYIFTFAVGFPFQIYVAQSIGASGVGLLSLVDSGVQVLAGIMSLGIAPAMLRYIPFYRARRRLSSLRAVMTKGIFILLLAGVVGYVLLIGIDTFLSGYWQAWDEARDISLVLGLSIPLSMLLFFATESLRGFGDVRSVVVGNSFLQTIIKVLCTIVLFSFGWRELGVAWAIIIGLSAALAWMAWVLWRRHLSSFWNSAHDAASPVVPQEWVRYARVMYVGSLIGIIVAPVDRMLLGSWSGSAAVGVYAVVMTLHSATGVVQLMLLTVAAPMFAEIDGAGFDRRQAQELYAVCTDWGMRATLPAIVFLFVFVHPVLYLFGPVFAEVGYAPLLILLAAQLFGFAIGPGGRLLKMVGFEGILLKSAAYQGLFSVVAFGILIPWAGVLGAAIAVAINLVISNLVALWVLIRHAGMKWYSPKYRRWVTPAALTVFACVILRQRLDDQPGPIVLILLLGMAYLVFHAVYFAAGMGKEDREIWEFLKQKLGDRIGSASQWVVFRELLRKETTSRGTTAKVDNRAFPSLRRPVVIFHSDDWGLAGAPDLAGIERLRKFGVGESPWDRYGMETREDLQRIAETLGRHVDSEGRQACFTANFIVANADLRRMEAESFQRFRAIPIESGFPAPWNDVLAGSYRELVSRGVFYPGLHGYTHFGVDGFMAACRDDGERGVIMKRLLREDIAFSGSLTPEFHFALVDIRAGQEFFISRERQREWVAQGVELFAKTFGHIPVTTCAPGYRCNDVTVEQYRNAGIQVIQTADGRPLRIWNGMLNISRNTTFEPLLQGDACVEAALVDAHRAVKQGKPIVVCSHSINYITRHNGYSEKGCAQLDRFLTRLRESFPELAFFHDGLMLSVCNESSETWFEKAT
jgi:O-antigen/teichoic acid export membrane protein